MNSQNESFTLIILLIILFSTCQIIPEMNFCFQLHCQNYTDNCACKITYRTTVVPCERLYKFFRNHFICKKKPNVISAELEADTNITAFNHFLQMSFKEATISELNLTTNLVKEIENFKCFQTSDAGIVFELHNWTPMPFVVNLVLKNGNICDISGNWTKTFPNLKDLSLENDYYTTLPNSLQQIQNLVALAVVHTLIHELPENGLDNYPLLEKFIFNNNCIQKLPGKIFSKLSNLHLLELRENNLQNIPSDLLKNNDFLEEFCLDGNEVTELPENLFSGTSRLERLNLSGNKLTSIHKRIFSPLRNLQEVYLHNNHLTFLSPSIFISNRKLRILYLSQNYLTSLPFLQTELMADIDLSHNNITVISSPIVLNIPQAEKLILNDNCIQNFTGSNYIPKMQYQKTIKNFECPNCCLDNIHHFGIPHIITMNLRKNRIKILDPLLFENFSTISTLDLSENFITTVNVKEWNYNHLLYEMKILLNRNPLHCDCKLYNLQKLIKYKSKIIMGKNRVQFFLSNSTSCASPLFLKNQNFLEVGKTEFRCDVLSDCPATCKCEKTEEPKEMYISCVDVKFKEFPHISFNSSFMIHLNLSNNQISSMPSKASNIWDQLKTLDLSVNSLKSVENIRVESSLREIHLNNNYLKIFQPEIMELLADKTRRVFLSNNDWICDCNILLEDGYNKEGTDLQNLTCLAENKSYNFFSFLHYCKNIRNSSTSFLFFIIFPVAIIFLIIGCVLTFLFIRFKSEIKYYMFLNRICLRFVTEEDIDADKKYDAFLSYSSLDSQWVNEFLINGLENEFPRYKICLHERDWSLGTLIIDEIAKSVNESRRTIIVLTKNFLESEWSRMEFTLALQRSEQDRIRRLIVVVPEELPDLSDADESFRNFITFTTYLQANKPYFWRKLHSFMPRRKDLVTITETAI